MYIVFSFSSNAFVTPTVQNKQKLKDLASSIKECKVLANRVRDKWGVGRSLDAPPTREEETKAKSKKRGSRRERRLSMKLKTPSPGRARHSSDSVLDVNMDSLKEG